MYGLASIAPLTAAHAIKLTKRPLATGPVRQRSALMGVSNFHVPKLAVQTNTAACCC